MDEGVRLEMLRVAQDPHKEVLCANVHVQRAADDEAGEGDAVRDALDSLARAAERGRGNPLAAPGVDDQAEGEVGGRHEAHAQVHGFGVVSWFAHFGDDGEEGGGCGARAEDCCGGGDAYGEGGIANGAKAEIEGPGLGGCGRSIAGCDADSARVGQFVCQSAV